MAKKKEEQAATEATVEKEVKTDSFAVGHRKLENGKYEVILVPFSTKDLTTGETQVYKQCDDLYEAYYEFKMAAYKNGLI
jgi:hypothetical protein